MTFLELKITFGRMRGTGIKESRSGKFWQNSAKNSSLYRVCIDETFSIPDGKKYKRRNYNNWQHIG